MGAPRSALGAPAHLEPWLDKKALAKHLGCSVSWVEKRMAEGMTHALFAGRVKFKASEVERWLEERGYLERRVDGAVGRANAPRRDARGCSL
jgi:predicted DNA-binding transcriptional regulator AlpA